MIKLSHITSLHSAVSIIRTGRFNPVSQDPLCADAGINSFIDGREANLDQHFEEVGARLILNWHGPVQLPGNFPLQTDVLYDYGPWRAFIPVGSQRYLNVASLECSPGGWADLETVSSWTRSLFGVTRLWKSKHGAKARQEVGKLISRYPSVRIGNPVIQAKMSGS